MKRIFLALMLLSFFAYPAFAELEVQVDGVVVGGSFATQVNFTGDVSGSGSGSIKTIGIADAEKTIQFTPADFLINTPLDITASSGPGLEVDNKLVAIVWADGETTPIQVTFKVPADYESGGAFKVFVDESDSTTPNQIDFLVYINSDSKGWDTSATNQTPVALTVAAASAEMVTLSVATDFSVSLLGKVITLEVWRDDTADGSGDLELYYAEFFYN